MSLSKKALPTSASRKVYSCIEPTRLHNPSNSSSPKARVIAIMARCYSLMSNARVVSNGSLSKPSLKTTMRYGHRRPSAFLVDTPSSRASNRSLTSYIKFTCLRTCTFRLRDSCSTLWTRYRSQILAATWSHMKKT